jgi:hypothetical protein
VVCELARVRAVEGLALLAREDPGELIEVRLQIVGDRVQDPGALGVAR